jgi:uncharacterized protein YeaO (DUF488 family)
MAKLQRARAIDQPMPVPTIHIKRVYDAPSAGDGARILVDRLWPRGCSKETLKLDLWAKEVAPSNALRQWYHRDLGRYADFRKRYLKELEGQGGRHWPSCAPGSAAVRRPC